MSESGPRQRVRHVERTLWLLWGKDHHGGPWTVESLRDGEGSGRGGRRGGGEGSGRGGRRGG